VHGLVLVILGTGLLPWHDRACPRMTVQCDRVVAVRARAVYRASAVQSSHSGVCPCDMQLSYLF